MKVEKVKELVYKDLKKAFPGLHIGLENVGGVYTWEGKKRLDIKLHVFPTSELGRVRRYIRGIGLKELDKKGIGYSVWGWTSLILSVQLPENDKTVKTSKMKEVKEVLVVKIGKWEG